MKKMNRKGFTIVELVIVIAVIAILAAVMIPTFSGIVEKAQESAIQQEAAAIWKEIYALDLSDGKIDGNEGNTAVEKETGVIYTVTEGTNPTFTFSYSKDGKIAEFDGSKWTVGDCTHPEAVRVANDGTKCVCGKTGLAAPASE